jgi:hypothetical protein
MSCVEWRAEKSCKEKSSDKLRRDENTCDQLRRVEKRREEMR